MHLLLDVAHQAEGLPLRIHLLLSTFQTDRQLHELAAVRPLPDDLAAKETHLPVWVESSFLRHLLRWVQGPQSRIAP